jgi:hypothetical protein
MKVLREGPRRSLVEGERLVAEFEASDLGRKAFCRSRAISVSTLDYWRKRTKVDGQQALAAAHPGFIEIAPLRGVGALDVELELGGGVVLRLRRSG